MLSKASKDLVEQLSRSAIYQDYERAFRKTTGLPLSLRPVEIWQPVHRGKKQENPFCILMAEQSRSCAACLEVQQKIAESPAEGAQSITFFAGLCDTAVPVRLGNQL